MAAILAAFANWSRNASHSICCNSGTNIETRSSLRPVFSFQGESGHFVGPTAGAHHLTIVYRPEAFDASDLTGAGQSTLAKAASGW